MELKVWKYYDVTCSQCGFSRSTDFEFGWETDPKRLRKIAKQEGWKALPAEKSPSGCDETLCPICAAKCANRTCREDRGSCDKCDSKGFCIPALKYIIQNNKSASAIKGGMFL